MIELGAYWAHYSMWLKKARPEAENIMVEQDSSKLAVGRNNFARNGFDSQQAHHQIVEQLKEFDYRVEVTSDFDHETTSFDGLLFASSPRAKPLFSEFKTLGRAALATSHPDLAKTSVFQLLSIDRWPRGCSDTPRPHSRTLITCSR